MRAESEAGIEEAGVVRAQLTACRVVGDHFRGELRRDRDAFRGEQEIERFRFQDNALSAFGVHRLPEVNGITRWPGHVQQPRVRARLVTDDVAGQVDADEKSVGQRQLLYWFPVPIQQRSLRV